MKLFDKISDGLSNMLLPISNERIKVVVLCFVTATTFWFFNALNDNYTTRINYPISFNYNDSLFVEVEELSSTIKINVDGGGWNLLRKTLRFTTKDLIINLEDPANEKFILGSSLYTIISDQMTEIQLNFIETDTLWIAIDSIKEQKVAITFDSAGTRLAENFAITSPIRLSVDTAIFTGPQRFIKNIPDNLVLKSKKDNIKSDHDEDIMLATFGSSLVRRNPVEVEVSFEVSKFIKEVLMLPYELVNAPIDSAKYILADSLATLKFNIQEDFASQYSLDSFKIVLNYAQMSPLNSEVAPQVLKTPSRLKNTKIEIDTIRYKYKIN